MNQMKNTAMALVLFLTGGTGPAAGGDSTGAAMLRAYEDLAADSLRPDSVRMAAAGKRADAAFSLREYETARDYYRKAGAFEKEPGGFQYRYALSALANGDTAEALATLARISSAGNTALAHESQVVLGELALKRNDFKEAMTQFRKTGPFQPLCSWAVPAALGKLTAARALGLADSAAVYERQLSGYSNTMLEKERFRQVRSLTSAAAQDSSVARPSAGGFAAKPGDSSYTLQIGAFGSRERANALRKKLAAAFRGAVCVPAVIDERTFYRVQVGDFPTRDEAENFARKKLTPQGYVYRVVVKE
jgi:tetratricopeptide (TPR) repeat protein